ncbi:MAG: AzlD domain-containing protein [Streptosporangiales bacterium]
MSHTVLVVAAVLALAVGTFALRYAGPSLRSRVEVSPGVERLLSRGATVLLVALVATTALIEGDGFAGFARPAGVAVGGLLAWRRAPFIIVVLGAACTTAVLRLLGVP